jgi:signal transduction histidine kinase
MEEATLLSAEAGLPAGGPVLVGPPRRDFRELEHARRHLSHLYEISKLLSTHGEVKYIFPGLMALASQVLPLRTALLLEGMDEAGEPLLEYPHLTVGRAEEVTAGHMAAAASQAAATYAYLLETGQVDLQAVALAGLDVPGSWSLSASTEGTAPAFITLPLVSQGHIFGTLQIEVTGLMAEEGLAFVDAVANLLAGALDRHYVLRREVSMRERAQALERLERELVERERQANRKSEEARRRQRLLAKASALLVGSLDYRATLKALAGLLVPGWAECCAIDLFLPDQDSERVAMAASEPPGSPSRSPSFLTRALASHPWMVSPVGPGSLTAMQVPVERAEWVGFPSNLRVPLLVRGRALGALSLISAQPGRYVPADEALFEELAQRIAKAVDTAQLHHQLQEAVQWREELLSTVSHDLKTPLMVVKLNAELLLRDTRSPESERRRYGRRQLEIVLRAVEQMNGLIAGILDRARLQGTPLPLERQPLPVAELFNQALEMLGPLAMAKQQVVGVEVEPRLPRVTADRARILQVLANLLGNAIKFTPPGGIISLRAQQKEGVVRISVKDSGPGISAEGVPHLFERFWRATNAVERGTGLGLSIAKSIVQTHGGAIWVETGEGAGSTFCFTLPVARR